MLRLMNKVLSLQDFIDDPKADLCIFQATLVDNDDHEECIFLGDLAPCAFTLRPDKGTDIRIRIADGTWEFLHGIPRIEREINVFVLPVDVFDNVYDLVAIKREKR